MKKIIVGNWKMNPDDIEDAKALFSAIKRKTNNLRKTQAIICAPYIYLDTLSLSATDRCEIGAQDCFYEKEGAYTGKISPSMLKKLGVLYTILGHSEVRKKGDTNEIVNRKIKNALDYRMKVIVCIGEYERDSDGKYLKFIKEEVQECFAKIPKKLFTNVIIAYEPIWAIGETAKGASTPEDFFEQSTYIRKILSRMLDNKIASEIPIIYGGSTNSQNAEGFLNFGADGLLPGRASLDKEEFSRILEIAENSK